MFYCSLNACAFETRWRGEHRSRFGRGRVRGMLPPRPPLWVSILFCKNRRADKPAAISFRFCVAAGTSRGSVFRPPCSRAIERFRTREQQGGIASGHLSNCSFPVERPRISIAWCVLAPRSSHRPPRAPDVVRRALGRPVDCRRPIVRLLPVITVTYPRGLSLY